MKRSPGRPEAKPAFRLSAKAWFIAVSQASQKNASQLEVYFADPRKKPDYKLGKGPGLWSKYQRGAACPKVNDPSPDKPSLVNIVERKFPGTKRWLTMPFWRLLSMEPLDANELKSIFLSLSPEVSDVIVHATYHPKRTFWRVQSPPEAMYRRLVEIGTIDAATAIMALIKEAEINQNQHQHRFGLVAWSQCASKLIDDPVLGPLLAEINTYIDLQFTRAEYFRPGNPSDIYRLDRPEILAAWNEHGPGADYSRPRSADQPVKTAWDTGNEAGRRLTKVMD